MSAVELTTLAPLCCSALGVCKERGGGDIERIVGSDLVGSVYIDHSGRA